MKLLIASLLTGSAVAFAPSAFNAAPRTTSTLSETAADLETLAKDLNPVVKFFDPLDLASKNFWDTTDEETIGFLRESEVKHGRIAMFAFVGYIVHANGITFPWPMTLSGEPFPQVSSAPEAWDAIPEAAKLQIMAFVGFLEFWRESACEKHYMKGGKIGEFPPFNDKYIPGSALNLFDPFGWSANKTDEEKQKGLLKELNNGRLAMLGIFGFLSEGKIEGSVPALKGIIPHYAGEPMAPMDHSLFPTFETLGLRM